MALCYQDGQATAPWGVARLVIPARSVPPRDSGPEVYVGVVFGWGVFTRRIIAFRFLTLDLDAVFCLSDPRPSPGS